MHGFVFLCTRHIPVCSVSSSIHTNAFPFTRRRWLNCTRARNATKCRPMSTQLLTWHIEVCYKVGDQFLANYHRPREELACLSFLLQFYAIKFIYYVY